MRRSDELDTGILFGIITLAILAGTQIAALSGITLRTCPFLVITGHPCPTCFGTRAITLIAEGRIADALQLQPLVTAAALAGLLAGAYSLLVRSLPDSGRPVRPLFPIRRLLLWTLPLLFLANWAYLLFRPAL